MKGDKTVLRFSLDAKAVVKIGELSRGGQARYEVNGLDHDFHVPEKVTPYGILLPDHDRVFLYFTQSPVTSDFIVDCLRDCWEQLKEEMPHVKTLLLYQDNGPECNSRRTQFMHRMAQWADETTCTIRLAYYPPYHSKYNPIERVWSALERHWNGDLLDSVTTVIRFAETVRWKQRCPVVQFVQTVYETGQKLSQKAMKQLEQRFEREKGLEKWFVTIPPLKYETL